MKRKEPMDKLKPNPFIHEIELLLISLGLEVEKAKQIVLTGELLYFNFNDIPIYVCLPSIVPSPYSSIVRIEAQVAELPEEDAGRLVVSIVSYLSIHDCTPIRVIYRRSTAQSAKVLIRFVCDLETMRIGSLAPILLHICEVAEQMKVDLTGQLYRAG